MPRRFRVQKRHAVLAVVVIALLALVAFYVQLPRAPPETGGAAPQAPQAGGPSDGIWSSGEGQVALTPNGDALVNGERGTYAKNADGSIAISVGERELVAREQDGALVVDDLAQEQTTVYYPPGGGGGTSENVELPVYSDFVPEPVLFGGWSVAQNPNRTAVFNANGRCVVSTETGVQTDCVYKSENGELWISSATQTLTYSYAVDEDAGTLTLTHPEIETQVLEKQ